MILKDKNIDLKYRTLDDIYGVAKNNMKSFLKRFMLMYAQRLGIWNKDKVDDRQDSDGLCPAR